MAYPDARLAYHPLTFGWLCDELVRRVTGASVGRFYEEFIRQKLGIEAWIGLPASLEPRVSKVSLGESFVRPDVTGAPDYARRVYFNPPLFGTPLPWNLPKFHQAEIPAVNGIATARAMAKYMACLASDGRVEDGRLWSPEIIAEASMEYARAVDPFSGEECAFGLGFELQTDRKYFGPPADAFGQCGAGGSVHGAWPSLGIGFSYCMNEMRHPASDLRGRRLLQALYDTCSKA